MAPKRNRKFKARKNNKYSRVVDTVIARVTSGSTTTILLSDLTFTDRRRPFRITSVRWDATADAKPICLNVRLFGPQSSADTTTTSGLFQVEGVPKRGFLKNRTKLFYPSGTANATQLIAIDAICVEKTMSATGTVVLHATLLMGPEEYPESCPKIVLPSLGYETEYDTCDSN